MDTDDRQLHLFMNLPMDNYRGMTSAAKKALDQRHGLPPKPDDQQTAAITSQSRPLLIAGPAGSGKSFVIGKILSSLINTTTNPAKKTLVLVSGNSARQQLQKDLAKEGNRFQVQQLSIRRLAESGYHFLEKFDPLWRHGRPLLLLPEERLELLKQFSPRAGRQTLLGRLNKISLAKQALIHPGEIDSDKRFYKIFQLYQKALQDNYAIDSDDLFYKPIQILEAQASALTTLPDAELEQFRYDYILVDLPGGLSRAAYFYLRWLGRGHNNFVMAIDPLLCRSAMNHHWDLQSQLQNDFENLTVIEFQRHYRFAEPLEKLVRQVAGLPKLAVMQPPTNFTSNSRTHYYRASNDQAEADYIARQIRKLKAKRPGRQTTNGGDAAFFPELNSFAILYFHDSQRDSLVEGLRRFRLPFQILDKNSRLKQSAIRDLLALLRLYENPHLASEYRHLLMLPRFDVAAEEKNQTLPALFVDGDADNLFRGLNSEQRRLLWQLQQHIAEICGGDQPESSVLELLDSAIRFFKQQAPRSAGARLGPAQIEWLKSLTTPTGISLPDLLRRLFIAGDSFGYDPDVNNISLMPVAAADMVFDMVFVCGCDQRLMPITGNGKKADARAAKNLFYGGMSRARERLYISNARKRLVNGKNASSLPAAFLAEIDFSRVKFHSDSPRRPQATNAIQQLTLFP